MTLASLDCESQESDNHLTTSIQEGVLRIQGYLGSGTWELSHAYRDKHSAVWHHSLADGRTVPLGDNTVAVAWITEISGLDSSFHADHRYDGTGCWVEGHHGLIVFDEFNRQNPPPSPVSMLPLSGKTGAMYGLVLQWRGDGQYQRLGVFYAKGPPSWREGEERIWNFQIPFNWLPIIQKYGKREIGIV